MSSSGVMVADGGPEMYFCHQCDRTVTISPSPGDDILCPSCNSGFVEEFQNPNPGPTIPDPFFPDPLTLLLTQFLLPSANASHASGSARVGDSSIGQDDFDPASYLLNLLANRRASGTDYQFVIEDNPYGDYLGGPGFEQLIQQLAENDPNRYGTPPASKPAVEALPSIVVAEALLKSELAQCAVCKDEFEMGTTVKQMPCKHVYHHDCILPWLELHNSCPVCRHELPTDDPDYESRDNSRRIGVSRGNGGSNSDEGRGGGGSDRERIVERRYTTSSPWLFGLGPGSSSGSSGEGAERHNREQN